MAAYRGHVDGLFLRQLIGWVVNIEDINERPNIIVLLDGRVIAVTRADQHRKDLADLRVGDGAHGFKVDLSSILSTAAPEAEIDVLVGSSGWTIPGSPVRCAIPPCGRIDHRRDGEIVGWAHGEAFRQTRLEIIKAGVVLVAWPCEMLRRDLARLQIGDGRFGFQIPVERLCGCSIDDLVFRIEGSQIEIAAPRAERMPSSALPRKLPAPRFASAREARRALIAALAAPADQAHRRRNNVRLSFAVLQTLLNELSYLENQIADERQRSAFRNIASKSARPSAADKRAASSSRVVQEFSRLSLLSNTVDATELVDRIRRDLIPLYLKLPNERADFQNALSGSGNSKLLRSVAKAFRSQDFLAVPAIAYSASLRDNSAITPENIQYWRQLQSWFAMFDFAKRLPRNRIVQATPVSHRTLYVLWRSVPYDTNGYCTRSHYLLRAFKQSGEDIVAATRLGYPWDAEKRLSATAMFETIDDVLYLHLGGEQANRNTMGLEAYVIECAERIAHTALVVGADLIHSASNWMAGLPALLAARMIGLPFCYEIRGLWEITRASNIPGYELTDHFDLFREMEALTAKEADLVFTITTQVREEMARRGVNPDNVQLAPNGVEIARFHPMEQDTELKERLGIGNELVFGFLGTFAKYEGLLDLCEATLELKRRGLPFKVLMVGDGPVFEDVKSFSKSHGLEHTILLIGRVAFTDVPRYYSIVDVAVFPRSSVTITEMVSPLKPFEAMAMAKPVIASNVAALAEIVRDGETGWLFQKGEISSLVDLLSSLICNRNVIGRASAAARQFVEKHHDWTAIAKRIAEGWAGIRTRGTAGMTSADDESSTLTAAKRRRSAQLSADA